MKYEVDAAGVELIASFEGYVNGVYNDSRGFCTGGFGHLFHESPATEEDHRLYDGKGKTFWLKMLHNDIYRDAIEPMNATLHVQLDQNEINPVASACYNCGPGFVEGTVGRLINARKWNAAANAFMLWDHPSVLIPRREQERALFLQGVREGGPPFPWLEPWERSAVLEDDILVRTNRDQLRRKQLRAEMTVYRKRVWHAAQGAGGWEIRFRRQRYRTLWART